MIVAADIWFHEWCIPLWCIETWWELWSASHERHALLLYYINMLSSGLSYSINTIENFKFCRKLPNSGYRGFEVVPPLGELSSIKIPIRHPQKPLYPEFGNFLQNLKFFGIR